MFARGRVSPRSPSRAGLRREAGDLEGARAALDRAARDLDVLDHGAIRVAIERVGKEMDDDPCQESRGASTG